MTETEFRVAAHASGVVPDSLKALIEQNPGQLGSNEQIKAITELIQATKAKKLLVDDVVEE
jgi:hypothetical protein